MIEVRAVLFAVSTIASPHSAYIVDVMPSAMVVFTYAMGSLVAMQAHRRMPQCLPRKPRDCK